MSFTIQVETLILKRNEKDFRLQNSSVICPLVYGQFCALNEKQQGGNEITLGSVYSINEMNKLAGDTSHPTLYRAKIIKEEKAANNEELWTYSIYPTGQGKSSSWHYGWKSSRFMRDTLHCKVYTNVFVQ